jgi:twitching motility protein PilU
MPNLQQVLKLMIDRGASDVFLTCGATPRIKIEGATHSVNAPVLKRGEVREMAYSIMSERQKATFEETLEANLSYSFGQAGRFRVNVFHQRGEIGMVIRQIKSDIRTFEQLGLPPQCAGFAMLKRGLVLFVGAAGAGKSTSLASMIAYRAANGDGHILTIEDPIEFLFRHNRALVDQREVSVDTHSFGDALRNAMREAPDVIMIGEIRDQETAKHAIAYAETGHLCLSTLHATNADQAIDRLVNFFPQAAQKQILMDLSLNLKAVISQRLIPSADGKAALATEVMVGTMHISDLIREGRVEALKEAMNKGRESGMYTFDQSLFELYSAGRITAEEALRNADSRTDLGLRIRLSTPRTVADAPNLTMAEAIKAQPAENIGKLYPRK